MEDISRELEKEIALAKPKPYKKSTATRVLIIDDFGQMKSGEHLKFFVRSFSVLSVIGFAAAVLFFYLYSDVSKRVDEMKSGLVSARQKVQILTEEKEVLMAKVVMLGKDPSTESEISEGEQVLSDQMAVFEENTSEDAAQTGNYPEEAAQPEKSNAVAALKSQDIINSDEPNQSNKIVDDSLLPKTVRAKNDMVAIEKFTVAKDGDTNDLLVRFNIRNISDSSGDISGRIFTILKPEKDVQNQWLVVPSAPLNDGIPAEYRKGQYFSIAHFKPVKFRIKHSAGPDFFNTASVYIFNSQGELVFEELIEITEENQSE